jgi:putative ABC transport system permease protein
MRLWFRDLPVAWLQLSHGRAKLLAAVVGIAFADLLMWMQLGFRAAAIDSSLYIHDQLRGELVLINPLTDQLAAAKPFPRRQLVRVLGHPEVEAAIPLYTGTVVWRDPSTGAKRSLFVYGIVPFAPAIGVPGVSESAGALHEEDTCLFDTRSRKEFGAVLGRPAVEASPNFLFTLLAPCDNAS